VSKLELLSTLYEYNEWADTVIVDAAAELPAGDLAAATTSSHESVASLLVHTLGAEAFWLARWKGEPFPTTPFMQPDRPLESLRESFSQWDSATRQFIGTLTEADMDRQIPMPGSIERMQGVDLPLWQVMMQIIQHGIHHRAEVQSALTAAGHPARDLDYILWEIDRRRAS
jgi:uncharacterized damage-inducible protein DinB